MFPFVIIAENHGIIFTIHNIIVNDFNFQANLPSVRSVSELASELSRSTTSLPGSLGSDISRSGSSASLPSLGASRFDREFNVFS